MNKKFWKELLKGSKWVVICLVVLAVGIAAWYWVAWCLGWYTHRFFDLKTFGPQNFVQFGSSMLVFTLIVQIITVILTGWFLLAWGRSRQPKEQEKV